MSWNEGKRQLARRRRNCGRIAELTDQLAGTEERLARLVITRETVNEVLAAATQEASPVPAEQPGRPVPAVPGRSPVIGVMKVPPWQAGLDVSVLPRDYRDLLEVTEDAGRPVRAAQIAAAPGLSTERGKVETLRARRDREPVLAAAHVDRLRELAEIGED